MNRLSHCFPKLRVFNDHQLMKKNVIQVLEEGRGDCLELIYIERH